MNFEIFSIALILLTIVISFIYRLKRVFKIFGLVAILISQGAFYYIHLQDQAQQLRELNIRTELSIQTAKAKLELSIRREEGLIRGLASFVQVEDTITQESWSNFSKNIMREKSGIINTGAAPNLVMSYVHPLKGNEEVVGLDFNKNKAQRDAAYLARDLQTFMVAGPIDLVQGGRAFIGRLAVVKPPLDSLAKDEFWGLVSAPIDMEFIFKSANLYELGSDYDIAIRGKDASGPSGPVFYGDTALFETPTAHTQNVIIQLPHGSWLLSATPKVIPITTNYIWMILAALFFIVPMIYLVMQNRYDIVIEKQQGQLEKEKLKAENAARAKASFLANMSHEIRTPMNGIRGSADLLKDITTDPDELEYVELIQGSCNNLLAIINDVLDVSKIESGKLELELIPTDYEDLIQNILKLFENAPDSNGNTFELKYSNDIPKVFEVDPVRISQVLNNLVSNANKFTQDGKITVEVRGIEAGGVVQVKTSVKDTGIGMTPSQLAKVFDRFEQADTSTTRLFGGTGLGTTISKQLIRLMGGVIRAESIEGKGSNFQFQLPMRISKADLKKINEESQYQFQGKVLLVEDNVINVKIATKTLKKFGVQTDVAENGKVGVDKALAGNYDLIFMDIQMPVMDGETAMNILKKQNYPKPIVALSANAMSEDVKHYREIGMDDVLAKPIERKEMIRVLNRFLAV